MHTVMASGTGKTRLMVNECYRLLKTKVAKCILFLVDRRALAAQAVEAFESFEVLPGLIFDLVNEPNSQWFFRDDFEEEEKFDSIILHNPSINFQ